jgi:O-antigen/teichoic acid export membrane protein
MLNRLQPLIYRVRGTDTGKAAGLAGAMIANNLIALIASVVFARVVDDYGKLAALISYLVILTVAGQAMQVATAREAVLGDLGEGEELLRTLERWARTMLAFSVVATVISVLARQPIADAVGVKHQAWAAAAGIPGGCMYMWLCILRGALQGSGDYRSVGLSLIGEQAVRLISGAALAELGLGLGGAYLGSLVSYLAMAGYCSMKLYSELAGPDYPRWRLRSLTGRTGGLWSHVRSAAIPIIALGIIQLLQNVDLITANHRFNNRVASSYAVVAVAAKVLIWVAMGASFHLVPETSRLRSAGEDARSLLLKTLGIILACAIPALLIFAVGAHPLLEIVFGKKRAVASSSLLPLGAAFTMLACTYLAVQYMLALRKIWFLGAIGLLAVVEPFLLVAAPHRPAAFASVVLGVQAVGAIVAYAIALRIPPPDAPSGDDPVEDSELLDLNI